MQFEFFTRWNGPPGTSADTLQLGESNVTIHYVRNPRARRYVLRLTREGAARVTIPRGGSLGFAREFARKNEAWLRRQLQRKHAEAARPRSWTDGTQILLRGETVTLKVERRGQDLLVRFGDESLVLATPREDLRPEIERHLWSLADKELRWRTEQLAGAHQVEIKRIVVRNQRSRWGSCSPRRTISLNWRLIQAPARVRDYLIVHELMHVREMNHSPRFWRLVEEACPDYGQAEAWLNSHGWLLR